MCMMGMEVGKESEVQGKHPQVLCPKYKKWEEGCAHEGGGGKKEQSRLP